MSAPKQFMGEDELDHSSVVANCRMNRERELAGTNSYTRDLGFDVFTFLSERLRAGREVAWLDLCCGTARALIQAKERLEAEHGARAPLQIHGVDLVDAFHPDAKRAGLTLHVRPIRDVQPQLVFDLLTCVHGLHYVGDKLNAIRLACSWLKPDGVFRANLDLQNLRLSSGKAAARSVARELRTRGLAYDGRRRVLAAEGSRELDLPFRYLGADDRAGPNSTGQPAVNSYYETQ